MATFIVLGCVGLVGILVILLLRIPIKYNARNLVVRWITSAMTVTGIALVTWVFVILFALGIGMENTLVTTAHPLNLVVIRSGSQSETNSSVSKEQAASVMNLDGIEKDDRGEPLVSPEVVVVANQPKLDGRKSNLAMRGVGPKARALRGNIRIVEGRWFNPGVGELVVGKAIAGRFKDLKVGDKPFIRGRPWEIVGVFTADGQAYESEAWGDLVDLCTQFKRENSCSSLIVRCTAVDQVARLARVIKDDKSVKLDGLTQAEYYKGQNQGVLMMKAMGVVMAFVLSIGAIFGAANTMYAAVASRIREIATMRVLGFGSASIWFSFMLEAGFLGLLGGILGSVFGRLTVHGQTTGTANWQTFSEMAFQFQVTLPLMGWGIVLAVAMGAIGGFFPAFRASRQTIAAALRGL